MADQTKTIATLVIGVAAGVILGILFAPDKGEKTRGKLIKLAKRTSGDLEDLADEGVSEAKKKVDEVKDKASRLASDIQGKAHEMASGAQDFRPKTETDESKGRMKPSL